MPKCKIPNRNRFKKSYKTLGKRKKYYKPKLCNLLIFVKATLLSLILHKTATDRRLCHLWPSHSKCDR